MALNQRTPPNGSLEAAVVGWIANQPNLATAQSFEGGWEGWAQIQLAMSLRNSVPALLAPKIVREKRIYSSQANARADLFVEATANSSNMGLELKCRTKSESSAEFQERFLKDLNKIQAGLQTSAKPCLMYSMGITNDPADLSYWDKWQGKYTNLPMAYLKAGAWYVVMWVNAYT